MLELGADKIAFVILRARDYDHGPDGRGGRNAYELRDFIADMTEDARRDALERIAPAELRRMGEGW